MRMCSFYKEKRVPDFSEENYTYIENACGDLFILEFSPHTFLCLM